MSLAGRIRTKGSTVSIYMPGYVEASDKSRSLSWTLLTSNVSMLLDGVTGERAQTLFGEVQGIVAVGIYQGDIAEEYGVVVTAGHRAGDRYRVAQINDFDHGRGVAHKELGLRRHKDPIP